MPPQTEAAPIAVSPPGALYTASFIPKYIDKSSATFALLGDGTVRVYNGSGQVVMQVPASAIQVKSYARAMYNAIKVNLQGIDYIFASDFNAPSGGLGGVVGIAGGEGAIKSANDFFKMIEGRASGTAVTQMPPVPPTPFDPNTTTQAVATTAPSAPTAATVPVQQYAFPQTQNGVTDPAAAAIRDTLAKRARNYTLVGSIIFGLSILLTLGSYLTSKDGTFYIFWYGMLLGGILLFRGIASKRKLG